MKLFQKYLVFLVTFLPLLSFGSSCNSYNEEVSNMDGLCICKPPFFRDPITGECQLQKSLKIEEGYEFRIEVTDPEFQNDFSIFMWVKLLYSTDSTLIQFDDKFLIERTYQDKILHFHAFYDSELGKYSTASNAIQNSKWTSIMFIHDFAQKTVKALIDETVVLTNPIPEEPTTLNETSSEAILLGYNCGLLKGIKLMNYVEWDNEFISFYLYKEDYDRDLLAPFLQINLIESTTNYIFTGQNEAYLDSSSLSWVEDTILLSNYDYYYSAKNQGYIKRPSFPIFPGNIPPLIVTNNHGINTEETSFFVSFWFKLWKIAEIQNIVFIPTFIKITMNNKALIISLEYESTLHQFVFSSEELTEWQVVKLGFTELLSAMIIQAKIGDQTVSITSEIIYPINYQSSIQLFNFEGDDLEKGFNGAMKEFIYSETLLNDNIFFNYKNTWSNLMKGQLFLYLRMDQPFDMSEPGTLIFYDQASSTLIKYETQNTNSRFGTQEEMESYPLSICKVGYSYTNDTEQCTACGDEPNGCSLCSYSETNLECLLCDIDKGYTFSMGACNCPRYYYMTAYSNCASCHKYCKKCDGPSNTQCSRCISGFELHGTTCRCPEGESEVEMLCQVVCGDGLRHSSEICDDGNTDDADGCSSSCIVEEGYICQGGSPTSPDVCYCPIYQLDAYFTNDWKQIVIQMDRSVQINSISEDSCQDLLSDESFEMLGKDHSCYVEDATILINIGKDSSFILGEHFYLRYQGLISGDEGNTCVYSYIDPISIRNDLVDIIPKSSISGSAKLIICEDLALSGEKSSSNSESFQYLHYNWEITNIQPDYDINLINQLNQLINSVDSEQIEIEGSQLPNGQIITVQLTITNFLSNSDSSNFDIEIDASFAPIIEIIGLEEEQYFSYEEIVLRVYAKMPSCSTAANYPSYSSNDILYSWKLEESDDESVEDFDNFLASSRRDLSYYLIPRFSLNQGNYYIFEVMAYLSSDLTIASKKYIEVNLRFSELEAFIIGGNARYQNFENEFKLDGSKSYDASSITKYDGLIYEWECFNLTIAGETTSCIYPNQTLILSTENLYAESFRIAPNSLNEDTTELTFQLKIRKDTREASFNQTIYSDFDNELASELLVPFNYEDHNKVNPNSDIVLSVVDLSEFNFEDLCFLWECESDLCKNGEFVTSQFGQVVKYHLNQLPNNIENSDLYLSFSLEGGITDENALNTIGTIELQVNKPPTEGTLKITPTSGQILSTIFKISAEGYEEENENNLPLRYQFFISNDSTFETNSYPLSDKISKSSFKTILFGMVEFTSYADFDYSSAMEMYIKVIVEDCFGATIEATTNVFLNLSANPKYYINYLGNMEEIYTEFITNNIEFYLKNIGGLIQQSNLAYELKLLDKQQEVELSDDELKNKCLRVCFNGGSCELQSSTLQYECICPEQYQFTSSCLLTKLEFEEELLFRSKILQKIMEIYSHLPKRAYIIQQIFTILKYLTIELDLLSFEEQEQIVSFILNEIESAMIFSNVFEENEILVSKNEVLSYSTLLLGIDIVDNFYSKEVQIDLTNIHERFLYQTSQKILFNLGKIRLQEALPGENESAIGKHSLKIKSFRNTHSNLVSATINSLSSKEIQNYLEIQNQNKVSYQLQLQDYFEFQIPNQNIFQQEDSLYQSSFSILANSSMSPHYLKDIVVIFNSANIHNRLSYGSMSIQITHPSSNTKIPIQNITQNMTLIFPTKLQRSYSQDALQKSLLECQWIPLESPQLNNYGCSLNKFYNLNQVEVYSINTEGIIEMNSVEAMDGLYISECVCDHLTEFMIDFSDAIQVWEDSNVDKMEEMDDLIEDPSAYFTKEFAISFAFIFIGCVILSNLASFYLHKIDVKNFVEDQNLRMKERILATFFPNPKEPINYFRIYKLKKESLIKKLRVYLGIDSKMCFYNSDPLINPQTRKGSITSKVSPDSNGVQDSFATPKKEADGSMYNSPEPPRTKDSVVSFKTNSTHKTSFSNKYSHSRFVSEKKGSSFAPTNELANISKISLESHEQQISQEIISSEQDEPSNFSVLQQPSNEQCISHECTYSQINIKSKTNISSQDLSKSFTSNLNTTLGLDMSSQCLNQNSEEQAQKKSQKSRTAFSSILNHQLSNIQSIYRKARNSLSKQNPRKRHSSIIKNNFFSNTTEIHDSEISENQIPQYSKSKFLSEFILAFKVIHPILSLFYVYDPSFPRPLRLWSLSVRFIGYLFISALFFNPKFITCERTMSESFFISIYSTIIMMILSTLTTLFFYKNRNQNKKEKNLEKEKRKQIQEHFKKYALSGKYFTMQEYYGLIIEAKKKFLNIEVRLTKFDIAKRALGILITILFIVGIIGFLCLFWDEYSEEEIYYWKMAFSLSFVSDFLCGQFIKVIGIIGVLRLWQMCRIMNIRCFNWRLQILRLVSLDFC